LENCERQRLETGPPRQRVVANQAPLIDWQTYTGFVEGMIVRLIVTLTIAVSVLFALSCAGDDGSAGRSRPAGQTPISLSRTAEPFPFNTPDGRTPYPSVAPGYRVFDGNGSLPELPPGAAVYLSLGDSLNWGCCDDPDLSSHPRLAHYLSERLNREVVWVSLAGNGTLRTFRNGSQAGRRPQLDAAEEVLARLREEGHDVVAITLSIGGNDVLELRTVQGCVGGARPDCVEGFQNLLTSYPGDMREVYDRLNAAKDPATPIFQNNYYDANHCGRPEDDVSVTAVTMGIFNETVYAATITGGAFPVDFETAFKGRACEYISGVDPTYHGYDVILDLHIAAYESLPPEYVVPWVSQ
jgi:lysophospholipase L1-like esterase